MQTLQIGHQVTDFGDWEAAFGRFAARRQEAGVIEVRVGRAVDDDTYVVIELDFGTLDQAERFQHFLRTQVWSGPVPLRGTPTTRILTVVPQ